LIGLAGAFAASGMLRTLLYGISRADVATYMGAGAVVLLAALAASAIPAWRAVRVDPMTALRT
jgi:ABC-type lipoprotein release transport system permease subunit